MKTKRAILISTGREVFGAPDSRWGKAMEAYKRSLDGNHAREPEPFPAGHCLFSKPVHYGAIRADEQYRPIFSRAWFKAARTYVRKAMRAKAPEYRTDPVAYNDRIDRRFAAQAIARFMVANRVRFPRDL